LKSDPFDKLRDGREQHEAVTSPLGVRSAYHFRSRPVSTAVKEALDQKQKKDPFYTGGLGFRFEHAESQFLKPGISTSITTPAREVDVEKENLYPHPTGTAAFLEYRENKVPTPLSYLEISKQTPVTYIQESSHNYIVTKEDVLKPRVERKPSNRVLFKESASDYAKRKNIIFKTNMSFELCHNMAHRFMGNQAQERDNIFVQTAHFNSQQLVVENVISKLAYLLGKIEVRQTCERFKGGNIGKLVKYELVLPGCSKNWEVEIRAEHAQVSPHVKSTEIHLSLIAEELMKSNMLEIKAKGEDLKKDLETQYQKIKKNKEKKSFAFHGMPLDSLDKNDKNVDFNL